MSEEEDKMLKEMLGNRKVEKNTEIVDGKLSGGIWEDKEESEIKKPKVSRKKKETDDAPRDKDISDSVAFETPQARFKKIVKDQGYNVGLENLTNIFFRGDTNDPNWLNETLILSNIPGKNRELIITSYYGTTVSELGINVSPKSKPGIANIVGGKPGEVGVTGIPNKEEELDPSKLAENELRDMVKSEKTKTALAQLRAMRSEYEDTYKKKEVSVQNQQPQVFMRQTSRPVFRDGQIIKNADGSPMYETISEPVNPTNSGGIGEFVPLLQTMLAKDNKPQDTNQLAELFRRFDERMASMERANELRSKEDHIKRLEDETKRVAEQFKRDLEQKEKENRDNLNKLEADRIRELHALETRFTETINHRKELDSIIGNISNEHKKEMDGIKAQLTHAQTNIERTVVSKGTDTVDKLTTKFADIAESVIKPMAGVMKDQYTLAIDQQRKLSGLPPLKESVPQVNSDELNEFIKE